MGLVAHRCRAHVRRGRRARSPPAPTAGGWCSSRLRLVVFAPPGSRSNTFAILSHPLTCGSRGGGRVIRLVLSAVAYVVESTSQLVHVPSSDTASGITTVAQLVQMQVGTLRVTALQVPTQSRERAAQAVGCGVAGADAEQGARSASCWSRRCSCRRGGRSASRKPLVVAAVVYVVETTSQLVHVPSLATASGVTTVVQVVQMQVATFRVMALPLRTRNRERVALVVGRGGRVAAVEMGGGSWHEGVAVVDKVWLSR